MQVAVVAPETTPLADADDRAVARVERTARGLAARDHDVTVYCTGWWSDRLDYTETRERDGVTYRAVTVSPATTSYHARVPALLAAERPDAVHVIGDPPAVLAARTGATLARAPLVVDWFGEDPPEDRLVGPALRAADRVVAPSELVRTRVRERGVPEDRTRVVPEAIDFDHIRAVEPVSDPPDVVAATPLDGDANLESVLLGLAELRDRDWSATVIGDGPEREAYEAQAADLSIDDRVTFAGHLPRDERLAHYRGAHVFCQTARDEVFAVELLWALACGCVGVVEYQADSAAHELVERRTRGFRVSTPEEIEGAIVEAGEFEAWTVDESLAEFDEEAIAGQWLDVYRAAGAPAAEEPIPEPAEHPEMVE
ncbi:glycosyltransferase [Haloglomus litoreum]|uniref:glycosyltransferase n=1 Tax=Haloglomus litoreum TaxID=3034026 RepID=UPI0023E77CF3|nr:glycosyltransferase [Haloglomus sp. DT116]